MRGVLVALVASFVMPAWSVLKRLANARDDLSLTALRATGVATVGPAEARSVAATLGSVWTSGSLTLSAVLSMRLPGRCRLDVASPDSSKPVAVTWAHGKRSTADGAWPSGQVAVAHACALLALHSGNEGESRQALERYLADLKVDSRLTSLGRVGEHVAVVIGDRAEAAASLWVYKDRFLPARVRFTDATGRWDLRFIDYASQATGEWFPRILEVDHDGERTLQVSLMAADGKARLDSNLFSL
jgi:hypothetical protein